MIDSDVRRVVPQGTLLRGKAAEIHTDMDRVRLNGRTFFELACFGRRIEKERHMKKKTLAIMMSMVLSVAMLSGCGAQDDAVVAEEQTESDAAQEADEKAEDTEQSAQTDEDSAAEAEENAQTEQTPE